MTLRQFLSTLLLAFFGVSTIHAQAILNGTVFDELGEPTIGASIKLYKSEAFIAGTASNFHGNFTFSVPAGKYSIVISYAGYADHRIDSLTLWEKKPTTMQIKLRLGNMLEEVVVTAYVVDPLKVDETTQGVIWHETDNLTQDGEVQPSPPDPSGATPLTSNDVIRLGTRNVNDIASRSKEAARSEVGSQKSQAQYIVDGIRVTGELPPETESRMRHQEIGDRGVTAPQATHPTPVHEAIPTYHNESYPGLVENAFTLPQTAPLSTFGADVDVTAYANVRRFLNMGHQPPAGAVRTEEMINYFNYDYPAPKGNQPVAFTTELGDCPWNSKHKLLHIGLQAKQFEADKLPPSNLVFLIDVSGSMNSPDKLPLLKEGYRLMVEQLRPQDKISIVVYAGAAGTVLEPTSGDNKQIILEAIDNLRAGGSTAGAAGLKLAYQLAESNFIKDGNNRIILATDGDFNVGTTDNETLEEYVDKKRATGIFLSVIGFGTGNFKDARMQALAENGNGNAAYIDNLLEARKVLVEEFGGTLFTVAKDVKLQVEFNPARVGSYRLLGYESRLLAPEDFNDDTKDAGDMGSGHTVTALYELIPTGVKSSFLPSIEALNYQNSNFTSAIQSPVNPSTDWATVRMKYKHPDKSMSQDKVEVRVAGSSSAFAKTSNNFRWSAAVAGWSLMLKSSAYLPDDYTYAQLIPLAESARLPDDRGYRAECIRLMEAARDLGAAPELVEGHR